MRTHWPTLELLIGSPLSPVVAKIYKETFEDRRHCQTDTLARVGGQYYLHQMKYRKTRSGRIPTPQQSHPPKN